MTRILVVDDISTNRTLLRMMLEKEGAYEILEAGDGEQAIAMFAEDPPDLVLMDINMPGMDGRQVTTRLKQMAGVNHVPVIYVTALSAETAMAEALAVGGDDFISKPVNLELLESKILAHLRIRDLNRRLEEQNEALTDYNCRLQQEQELVEFFFDNALSRNAFDDRYIRTHISSLETFNGDLLLAEKGPAGGLYVLLGDFTGHGLTAAMGTLPVVDTFFRFASRGEPVGALAAEIDRQLVNLTPPGMFLCATILKIDPRDGNLVVWAGGMPEAYLLGSDGRIREVIRSRHMPLGIAGGRSFDASVQTIDTGKGDRVYLGTDGVTDTVNSRGERFGTARLEGVLQESTHPAFEGLQSALAEFREGADQDDDTTFAEILCDAVPCEADDGAAPVADGPASSLRLSVTLSEEDIRDGDPIEPLVEMLGTNPLLTDHKGVVHTLLTEMYMNAVDHGLLGLDSAGKSSADKFYNYYLHRDEALQRLASGSIAIEVALCGGGGRHELRLRVTDSGNGFENVCPVPVQESMHGKGMQIIHGLCKAVRFSNGGRSIEAVYALA